MRSLLFVLLSAVMVSMVFSGTITGKVTSKKSEEALLGANVYLQGIPLGAATDEGGVYSLDVKDGSYILVCDYVGERAHCIVQEPLLGTGHAVQQVKDHLMGKTDLVLVTYADMPLLGKESLQNLVETL